MLRFGRIQRSVGMEKLHIEDQLEVYIRVLERHRKRIVHEQKRRRQLKNVGAAGGTPSRYAAYGTGYS